MYQYQVMYGEKNSTYFGVFKKTLESVYLLGNSSLDKIGSDQK